MGFHQPAWLEASIRYGTSPTETAISLPQTVNAFLYDNLTHYARHGLPLPRKPRPIRASWEGGKETLQPRSAFLGPAWESARSLPPLKRKGWKFSV